jgi:hypothetical protein
MDILLTKDLQNSWIFQDEQKLKWWLDIILMADENGEVHMSLSDLSHRWNADKSKVSRFLKKLNGATLLQHQMQHQVQRIIVCRTGGYKGACNTECNTDCNTFATPQERSSSSFSPIPPLSSSPKEIYNSSTAHTCEEEFIRRYRKEGDSGMWSNTAAILHKNIPACKELFERWIVEYQHNGETHSDYTAFKRHFISWSRIAISKESKQQQSNGNNRPDYSRRGRADVPEDISLDF